MCGITGYFNINNQFRKDLFSNANNIIKHRGPDDFGFITLNNNWNVLAWKDELLNDFNDNNVIKYVLIVAKSARNVIKRSAERDVISVVATRLNFQIRRNA